MRKLGLLACVLAAAAIQGCQTDPDGSAFGEDARIGLDLNTSSRSMVAGEVITVMAQTQNLLGRDAEIEWYAPGGEIQTENNGRIARVYFPDPGTYTVSAELFADGQQIRRDAVTIRVRPIK